MGEVKPEDAASGLVELSWVRTSRRGGTLRERTLEGDQVSATWLDETGKVQRADGKVTRNGNGQLVIESWADGVRQESSVPRNAIVDRTRR